MGEDKTSTIITYTGPAVEQLVLLGANTGLDLTGAVVIENFTFYNGGLTGDTDLIKFRARGVGGVITIRNNIFDGDGDGSFSSAKGIEESYQASNFIITQNEFKNCGYGIWLNGANTGLINHNTFSNSASGAIGMGGSATADAAPHDLTVEDNIMDSGTYGLVLAQNIHDISFTCNTIANNSIAGILLWEYGPDQWANVPINYNNIVGNTSGIRGYSDPTGNQAIAVDAIDNWWGDASGPSGNGSGSGDSVLLSNIEYTPWLTSEPGAVCPPPEDDQGPITSDVMADTNPASVNALITLTAKVDDTNTGGSNIASAEYRLGDNTGWVLMDAQDGAFDTPTEDVEATLNAPSTPGIYDLCVRGTDELGNIGPEDCIYLVVYDPNAGFVTGGGWFESPAGAYKLHGNDVFFNGFETNIEGWDVFGGDFDAIRVPSGTDGVDSASGDYHAEGSFAATNWGGYNNVFPDGGYATSIDVFLDVNGGSANDTRFDWTSAINQPDGNHRRDFVFNAGFYNDDDGSLGSGSNRFIVSVSNSAGRENSYPKNPGRDPIAITNSGWYTFQHRFYDNGSGVLAVDLSILDSAGNLVHSWTLSDSSDVIGSTVGGNRYGWFANNEFPFLAFDNSLRSTALLGKATFGFVSKYKKGATIPDGSTEFQFKAGDLNFHSSSYDWLVVTGSNYAKFKGAGTINGQLAPSGEEYKFQIWAGDDTPDTFRIKIWYEVDDDENVVYDNGSAQPIEAGSIIVHTSKK